VLMPLAKAGLSRREDYSYLICFIKRFINFLLSVRFAKIALQ
jgi:hypothetical protein